MVPKSHIESLSEFAPGHETGDYLLVHAGIKPGIPLDRQDPNDLMWIGLMWIGEEFLRPPPATVSSRSTGIPQRAEPEVKTNRIGLGTTASAIHVLT